MRAVVVLGVVVVAVVASAGCLRAPSGSAPKAATDAERSAALCARIRTEQEDPVKRGQSTWPEKSARGFPEALGRCWPTRGGAWALVLEGARFDKAGLLRARFALLHVSLDGHRDKWVPAPPWAAAERDDDPRGWNLDPSISISPPVLFDFDADGEEEIFLRSTFAQDGVELSTRGRILTFRDGEVSIYGRAKGLEVEGLRDMDADGRPDVLSYGPWAGPSRRGTACAAGVHRAHGPPLLAHARKDGGFAFDDEVARGFAREACPAPQSSVIRQEPGTADAGPPRVDGAATVERIGCARVWGVSVEAVLAEIDAACTDPAATCDHPSRCDDAPLWRRWAAVAPPVRLP